MFKDIDRTIIYYGVYDTDTEVFDESDILCSVRKKFFETRSPQKGRGNIKTAEGLHNYSYVMEAGVSLRYRMITKDGKQLARVFDTAGGYFAETLDYFHRPVKRAYFNKIHKWLKTEFISLHDRTVKFSVFPSRDGNEPVIVLRENNTDTVLYAFSSDEDREISRKLNKLTGTPRIFCSTSFGDFYFCTKENFAERKNALEEIQKPTYFSTEVYASWSAHDEHSQENNPSPETPETKTEIPEQSNATQPPAEENNDIFISNQTKCVFSDNCPYENTGKQLIEANGKQYFYFGETNQNKRHGKGRTVMQNGKTAFEGFYKDDMRDGIGVHYYKSGKLCYVGNWTDNKRNGLGVAFSPDDNGAFIGKWNDNKSVNAGAFFDCKGNLLYLGNTENGLKNGAGITYNPDDKAFFVGKYENGAFLEKGTLFNSKGDMLYMGDYKNNARNGFGTSYSPDGSVIYQGQWLDNLYSGEGILYMPDGCFIKGFFADGKACGKCTLSDRDNKIIYTGDFQNDLYNGKGRLFFADGGYIEGGFADGKPSGILNEYAPDNSLIYCGEWSDMHRNGHGTEYSSGEKIYEGEFRNSLYNGRGKQLFNGSVIYIGSFLDGMRDGFGVELWNDEIYYKGMWKNGLYNGCGILFDSGKPRYIGTFTDGKPHGRINEFADGRIIRQSIYENGIIVYTCDYTENGTVEYYGSIVDGMRNGMGCTFSPSYEKTFEGIFKNNSPDKPMKVILREFEEIPFCTELQNTEYEKYRISPEIAIEKNINSGIYTGSIKNSLPDGEGTVLYSDHRYTGHFSKGCPSGHGIVYMSDGSTKTGFFSVKPFEKSSELKFNDITYYFKNEVSQ